MEFENIVTIDCKQGAVRAVRFNIDGSYCLTCGSDKKLKLWNPYRNLLLKTYGGHGNEVLDAAGSCDSSQIVSASSDKSIILWDVATGQPLRRLRGHAASVSCVKLNEDSSLAVSGSHDNTVMLWDLKSRRQDPVQILSDAKDSISSLHVTDHEILTASTDCSLRRYDIRNGGCTADFLGAPVTCVSLTADGQCILASCADSAVRLLDKATGELLAEYVGHRTEDMRVESAVLCSDGHVLSGSVTGELWLWDLAGGEVAGRWEHERGKVLGTVSVHSGGKGDVVMTGAMNTVKLWTVRKKDESEDV